MVDEDGRRADIAETLLAGAQAEVGVLEISAPVPLRQWTDRVEAGARDIEAEAHSAGKIDDPIAVDRSGDAVDLCRILQRAPVVGLVGYREAGKFAVVRHRGHGADIGSRRSEEHTSEL